jgi:RNA polymerase sigma-70 factor (ECF subfamily)
VGPSVGRADAREDVRWAVAQLSEPHREVVELGVFQDLPYAEVAEILGIPVGTVKSRMSNALKKLKEVFDERRS